MAFQTRGTFSVYEKADAEGFLERLNTGITSKFVAKSRYWCELYGTDFITLKEGKRHSVSVSPQRSRSSSEANVIDMKSVHVVRKVTSDKSGTQFEILCKNKSQTFCAATAAECDKWIKLLQHAMTLKDHNTTQLTSTEDSSMEKKVPAVSVGDYETIDVFTEEGTTSIQLRQSTSSESGYAEIGFHNQPADPKKIPNYAAQNWNTTSQKDEEREEKEPVKPPAGDERREEDYGYSRVQMPKSDFQEDQKEESQTVDTERTGAEGEDSYGYAKVQPRKAASKTSPAPQDEETPEVNAEAIREPADGAEENEEDDTFDEEDELYVNATSCDPDPIPQLPHPLTVNDMAPVKTVVEFLTQHKQVCRRSYYSHKITDDPLATMKRFLQEISSK